MGSDGCKPQNEDVIKLKKSGSGWWGSSRGSGRGAITAARQLIWSLFFLHMQRSGFLTKWLN